MAAQLRLVVNTAHSFSELVMNETVADITNTCGVQGTTAVAIQLVAKLSHDASHILDESMVGLREILSCGSFNPIYTTFVHDGEFDGLIA